MRYPSDPPSYTTCGGSKPLPGWTQAMRADARACHCAAPSPVGPDTDCTCGFDGCETCDPDSAPVPVGTPTPTSCKHCWHQWGSAGGGVGSDGSTHSKGANRCCNCGEIERYEHRTGPANPRVHGQFYPEILRFPA